MFGSEASIITSLCYSSLLLALYVLFVIGFMWWRPVLEMDVSGGEWKVIVTVRGDCDLRYVKKMCDEDMYDEGRGC